MALEPAGISMRWLSASRMVRYACRALWSAGGVVRRMMRCAQGGLAKLSHLCLDGAAAASFERAAGPDDTAIGSRRVAKRSRSANSGSRTAVKIRSRTAARRFVEIRFQKGGERAPRFLLASLR
jgi:hypothetical protein